MCTCGETEKHAIGRRRTADNAGVILWSDGRLSGPFGGLPGVPAVRANTEGAQDLALRAGWLFLGEVELYERGELAALYEACRWAAERDGLPGTVRKRMHREAPLRPVWTLIEADRDGQPVERVWKLPRLRWSGLAVWDRCRAVLRYEVMHMDRQGTCRTTGFRFRRLDELAAHLRSIPAR